MALEGIQLHLVNSMDDASRCIEWLGRVKDDVIGFDTEGTGIDTQVDKVRLIQFGDENEGWSIPYDRWSGLAVDIINRWDKRFVGWNARYDVSMLANMGISMPIHRVDDGRFLGHINNPTESTALKRQAAKYIDPRAASMQESLDAVMRSGNYTWANIPIVETGPLAAYWHYASLDPIITVRLWNLHSKTVLVESPKAYDLELSMGWLATRMENAGVLVDREYTSKQGIEFDALHHSLTQRIRSEFGVEAGSKDQVVNALLKDGVILTKRTPGGDFALDKAVMGSISHPLVQLISERRKVEKLRSTYLSRFMQYSERSGRIHARVNTVGGSGKSVSESGGEFGVRTGRMSLESPNLQQLPRGGDPLSSVIRNCIVAGEGKTLLMCDYDQIELRLMAHLSRDKGLAEAFAAEGDFFTTLTRGIYHDPSIDKKDRRRQLTKSYVYATLYGAGNDKLATTTGVPLAEVEQLSRDFAASYSGVPAFQQAVQRRARERGQSEGVYYTRSPLTNRKFIGEQGKEYKLVNFTIQGMAAELLKMKLLELDAAGLGDAMRLPVHDEVILEVDDADVPDAVQTLRDVMNDDQMLSIPITAGVASGKRWGMKEDYDVI